MINRETQLEYANTDPSLHYNRIAKRASGPTWQGIWIYLLKIEDYESAQLVRDLNASCTDECRYGDHDYCHYPNCECVCHRAVVLKAEGAPIKSCRELQSEREESEVA